MNKQQRRQAKRLIFESLENRWLLAADTLPVELVSTGHPDDPAAAVGNDRSTAQSMSADGRFVAFRSSANNLVAGDSNGVDDVFRKDLVTGELALVSTAKSGEIGNGSSTGLAMSADGRFVAFSSRATNLVSIDRNGSVADIYVKDMQTGKVTLVSETASQQQSSSGALGPAISADGRYVAFVGGPIGDSGAAGIYRKDLRTNRLELVAEGFTTEVAISGDGNLVLYNVGFVGQLRVRNMTSGEDTLVSAAADGTPANGGSLPGSISLDGRFVAFGSYATNLVAPDGNGSLLDLFVKDLQTGEVRRVSDASDGAPANDWSPWGSLSADGRYVAFESDASNLVEGDTNGNGADVFVRDLLTNELRIVSNTEESTSVRRSFRRPAISADGRFVAFDSAAPGHVTGDTNNTYDVFRADLSGAWAASAENSPASAAAYSDWLDFLAIEPDAERLKSKAWRTGPRDSATACAAIDELLSQLDSEPQCASLRP